LGFIAKKEFDGKLVKNDGTLSTTGDLASLQATAGKDMYLAKAKVNVEGVSASNSGCTVVLKINGVIVETYKVHWTQISASQALNNESSNYEFVNIGQKVATGEIIKLEVTAESGVLDINGSIVCFEEPTGGDPTA